MNIFLISISSKTLFSGIIVNKTTSEYFSDLFSQLNENICSFRVLILVYCYTQYGIFLYLFDIHQRKLQSENVVSGDCLYACGSGLLCYLDLCVVFISWFLVHGKPFLTADITLCVIGKIRPS